MCRLLRHRLALTPIRGASFRLVYSKSIAGGTCMTKLTNNLVPIRVKCPEVLFVPGDWE